MTLSLAERGLWAPLLSTLLLGTIPACGDSGDDDDTSGGGGSAATGGSATTGGMPGDGDGDTGGMPGDGDGDGDTGGSPGDGGNGETCERSERAGGFAIYPSGELTTVTGSVAKEITPSSISVVLAEEGACRLLGPPALDCSGVDEGCPFGTVCAGDNQCVPERESISAGDVTVSGLLAELEVVRSNITSIYNGSFDDPSPGFAAGDAIQLVAPGDTFEAFTLDAWGVAQMQTSLADVPVVDGQPVQLTWDTDGVVDGQSEVFVDFEINTHGALSGWIKCEGPDNGSMEVPASLISQLMGLGLSGFPRMQLGRRSTDTSVGATGCVDLEVFTSVTIELVVDGIISCNEQTPCPDGMSCAQGLFCE